MCRCIKAMSLWWIKPTVAFQRSCTSSHEPFSKCSVVTSHTLCTAGKQVSRALSELHSLHERALPGRLTDQWFWETDTQTHCSPVQRRGNLGKRIYSFIFIFTLAFCMVWILEKQREAFLPPAVTLHNIIIDFHQQHNPVYTSFIRHDSWTNTLNLLLEIRWWR